MNLNEINFKPNVIYSEEDIFFLLKATFPSLSTINLKWKLFELVKNKKIISVGTKKYVLNTKEYIYEYYDEVTKNIDDLLSNKYKNIKSVLWENRQLNEWLNLLIAKNIIIVEIEKGFEDFVFEEINNNFKNKVVLLKPESKVITRYIDNGLVIVKTLYSRSPLKDKTHLITLEKLVVDLIADSIWQNMLDTKSIEEIIIGIKDNYYLNKDKMITYAKRRNRLNELKDIWGDNFYD